MEYQSSRPGRDGPLVGSSVSSMELAAAAAAAVGQQEFADSRKSQSKAKVRRERVERLIKKSGAPGSSSRTGRASPSSRPAPLESGGAKAEPVGCLYQMELNKQKSDTELMGPAATEAKCPAALDREQAASSLTLNAHSLSVGSDLFGSVEPIGSADLGAAEVPGQPASLCSSNPSAPLGCSPTRSSELAEPRPRSARLYGRQVSSSETRQRDEQTVAPTNVVQSGYKQLLAGSVGRQEIGAVERQPKQVKPDSEAATGGSQAAVQLEPLASRVGGPELSSGPGRLSKIGKQTVPMAVRQLLARSSSGNTFESRSRLQRIYFGIMGNAGAADSPTGRVSTDQPGFKQLGDGGQVKAGVQQPPYLSREQVQRIRDWLESQPGEQVSK